MAASGGRGGLDAWMPAFVSVQRCGGTTLRGSRSRISGCWNSAAACLPPWVASETVVAPARAATDVATGTRPVNDVVSRRQAASPGTGDQHSSAGAGCGTPPSSAGTELGIPRCSARCRASRTERVIRREHADPDEAGRFAAEGELQVIRRQRGKVTPPPPPDSCLKQVKLFLSALSLIRASVLLSAQRPSGSFRPAKRFRKSPL